MGILPVFSFPFPLSDLFFSKGVSWVGPSCWGFGVILFLVLGFWLQTTGGGGFGSLASFLRFLSCPGQLLRVESDSGWGRIVMCLVMPRLVPGGFDSWVGVCTNGRWPVSGFFFAGRPSPFAGPFLGGEGAGDGPELMRR